MYGRENAVRPAVAASSTAAMDKVMVASFPQQADMLNLA
jgi:hypothetical protein